MTHDLSFDHRRPAEALATPAGKLAFQRIGLSVAAAAGGLYGLGAVLSYSPQDPSLNVATSADPGNLFGGPGAVFADLAVQSLGAAAPIAAGALALAGISRIVRKRAPAAIPAARLLSGVAGAALLAGLASFAPTPGAWPLGAGFGGVFGDAIGGGLSGVLGALGLPIADFAAGLACGLGGAAAMGWAFRVRPEDLAGAADLARDAAGEAGAAVRGAIGWIGARQAPQLAKPAPRQPFAPQRAEIIVEEEPVATQPAYRPAAAHLDRAFEAAGPASAEFVRDPPFAAPQPQASAPRPRPQRAGPQQGEFPFMSTQRYELPSLEMLNPPKPRAAHADAAALKAMAQRLAATLADFGVHGEIVAARPGPVVTLFEFEPAPGVKSNRVITLEGDIARSMSATAARVAVIPGRNAIGIELPNPKRETVYLRSLLASNAFVGAQYDLSLGLGETIEGEPFAADLARMPHLLIAGTTGSGKSVGINAMILSLLYRLTPDQCRFIMIDPKMLELSVYEGVPHLLAPVVTDPKKAVVSLKWTVREMEERYRRMAKLGVRNIQAYNARIAEAIESGGAIEREINMGFDSNTGAPITEIETVPLETMPYIVVVIDEMADLMLTAGKEIEAAVQRLAQMARAAGIHVIMATQRPSVDVITGTIKANFPTRISYSVTSKIDSRTILGEQGAEQLLGMGDLLFAINGVRIRRLHGPYVTDSEVERVVAFWKAQGQPKYRSDILEDPDNPDEDGPDRAFDDADDDGAPASEDLYVRAVQVVIRDKRVSTSYLQRQLSIGYNRAANLIERMEKEGVISKPNASKKRDILVRGLSED